MGKDEGFRFSVEGPKIDPNSIKGVWELGIEPQPQFSRIVVVFKTVDVESAIRILPSMKDGDPVPDEACQLESFALDLPRVEALVAMLKAGMQDLRKPR